MGKKKKAALIAAVLWGIATVIWAAHIAVDLYYGFMPEYQVVLHGLCTLSCLFAAVVNFIRYKKESGG